MNHSEFLEDTVAFYSADTSRRAVDDNSISCRYRTNDGRKCAIGRFISDENYDESIEGCEITLLDNEYLPDWMRKLNKDFLTSMQNFHDGSIFWSKNGLSLDGENKYKRLKNWAKKLDKEHGMC